MAMTCPRCGAGLDITLFEFERAVQCECGQWVDLHSGHRRRAEIALFPIGQKILSASPARVHKESVMPEQQIGRVTHYFGNIQVAAIEITHGTLRVGDTIHIKGHTSDFTQTVESMQIEKKPVQEAIAGQTVGIKVKEHARPHDVVYKVES
ncbi:MAG: EF-Tu/IF-2/RF-3 family GTPase [Thermoguttaceae bacterium]|nr:EF-Tu/IF-2/RF-3 family GTPase [Thermoguttaceae bacterium]MDW8036671.1 EF-Tu/IF-2/RF-3 family GTPase [Thermoguttaceae bacterium]